MSNPTSIAEHWRVLSAGAYIAGDEWAERYLTQRFVPLEQSSRVDDALREQQDKVAHLYSELEAVYSQLHLIALSSNHAEAWRLAKEVKASIEPLIERGRA